MKLTTLLFLAAIFLGLSGGDGPRQSQSEIASLAPNAERTKSSDVTRLPEQAAVAKTEIASNQPVFRLRMLTQQTPLVFIVLPLALFARFGLKVARRPRASKPATVGATNE
jgi:hypothetical protein